VKDQYVGDINDYAKYALCRALTADGSLSLGVWWMRTPDDGRSDGALTGYLAEPARWSRHDAELFAAMASLVAVGKRSLQAVEESGILPGASFWPAVVPSTREERQKGFTELLRRFRDRDLILFDPDMGIEVASVPPGHTRSRQYVHWEELTDAYGAGHSLLVFQYFPRVERTRFVARRLEQIAAAVNPAAVCCVYTPRVAFFLAVHERHRQRLEPRLETFARRWHLPVMAGACVGVVQITVGHGEPNAV